MFSYTGGLMVASMKRVSLWTRVMSYNMVSVKSGDGARYTPGPVYAGDPRG
jgi:hypothetical protein